MRIRSVLCASALVVVAGLATAAPAMADPGNCPAENLQSRSDVAQIPGLSNAGPNSGGLWNLGADGPNTPGQAIKNFCQPGNANH